jgi:GNAT superfamily N-acetyltransferase
LVEVKKFLDPKVHPFLWHGAAAQFLALRGGEAVGRILVSDDPNYNRVHGTNVGCFGMFESQDDEKVASALLDAAASWLRARGRTAIQGPIDYSINYACGLLIDGFDTPPRFMMNHNPPYYGRLLESWGLAKAKDLYCWWFDGYDPKLNAWQERAQRVAKRRGVTVRPFEKRNFQSELACLRVLYRSAYEENWGFIDMSDAEFQYFAKRLSEVADPNLVLLAEVDGKPAGFAITMPDLNEAIQPLHGRLTTWGLPIGLARLLWRLARVKNARVMVLVVAPGYRRRGVAELLIHQTFEYGRKTRRMEGAELGWTLEDNHVINRTIEAVGGRRYKTYRVYQKSWES